MILKRFSAKCECGKELIFILKKNKKGKTLIELEKQTSKKNINDDNDASSLKDFIFGDSLSVLDPNDPDDDNDDMDNDDE